MIYGTDLVKSAPFHLFSINVPQLAGPFLLQTACAERTMLSMASPKKSSKLKEEKKSEHPQ